MIRSLFQGSPRKRNLDIKVKVNMSCFFENNMVEVRVRVIGEDPIFRHRKYLQDTKFKSFKN